jgi:DNA-binding PadR family transcriptional regulator
MTVGHVLLGILTDGPRHGYDVKRAHDDRFPGAKPMAYGQVYAALSKLERDGSVEVAEVASDGGPERTSYAITAAGRRALTEWLNAPEPAGPYAADELVRKVVTSLRLGRDAADVIVRQRRVHLAEMRRLLDAQAEVADIAGRIVLDHAVNHLDADLRWLESSAVRISKQSEGVDR